MTVREKIPTVELARRLRDRDGIVCQHPDCDRELDFDLIGTDSKFAPTIDHWIPQVECARLGWTREQIWDLSNLKLMHKACNAKKGALIPNKDGTLPPRKVREFRYRRDKRAQRPEVCEACNSGRWLGVDEQCTVCGNTAQPMPFPAAHVLKPNDCPHEGPWSCFACVLGIVPRVPAIVDVLDGRYTDE